MIKNCKYSGIGKKKEREREREKMFYDIDSNDNIIVMKNSTILF